MLTKLSSLEIVSIYYTNGHYSTNGAKTLKNHSFYNFYIEYVI